MSRAIWRLTVRGEFSAAHALRHYQGKCENMHGHNYTAEMSVEGETLTPDTEFIVDFSELKNLLRAELARLDHKNLNVTPPFDRINPSSENLARHLWQRLEPQLRDRPVRLIGITVSETGAQSATYCEISE
ncbi:MAG: 6-carboxytetrahydropterin synthase QueD [Desulfovibrionaceae bacterium]|nr:6-carboxytetrahydropterin synthase QueD [Desulfovibrionaceae bacterium]